MWPEIKLGYKNYHNTGETQIHASMRNQKFMDVTNHNWNMGKQSGMYKDDLDKSEL
jgi:hypothetical protein